ncbi:hypothetical protein CLOLEP_03974 [[Clostridium] leptum DSM 753]|uniref:Uncharacterized protein n=1 Tax=[Clostridium] leptum DSM 753 TaxID=428125 RepID=A7VZE4_9FIRM|nr:hypothetical protein CLOLEP_03974 [[Clostridium] leptum DSM 753]
MQGGAFLRFKRFSGIVGYGVFHPLVLPTDCWYQS